MELSFTIDIHDIQSAYKSLDEIRQMVDIYHNMVSLNQQASATVQEEETAEETAATDPNPKLGKGATVVFGEILRQIGEKGEATLEEVSDVCVMSIPTVRAHLMNGLRSYRSREKEPPFHQSWSPTRNCVVYTAR